LPTLWRKLLWRRKRMRHVIGWLRQTMLRNCPGLPGKPNRLLQPGSDVPTAHFSPTGGAYARLCQQLAFGDPVRLRRTVTALSLARVSRARGRATLRGARFDWLQDRIEVAVALHLDPSKPMSRRRGDHG
jgi:hypothetical protein